MKFRKHFIIMCMLFSLAVAKVLENPAQRGFEIKLHNVNQVEMCISNYGKFAQTAAGVAGLIWPKNTGQTYVFGAGLWFGTIDSLTKDTLVTIGYICTGGGASEYCPGLSGMSHLDTCVRIYMYPSLWPPPQAIFPMAPQTPVSNQDSWCCFNDSNPDQHIPNDTRPIGIEVYQTVYCWTFPWIEDVIFLIYDIKNASHHNLRDCYVGIEVDPDVLDYDDDYCSAILKRTYFVNGEFFVVDNFAYAWDYEDSYFEPGAVGFDFLQTPFDLVPGQDKDGDGILDQYERDSSYYVTNLPPHRWDVDNDGVPDWRDASENPQLGLTSFQQFRPYYEPIGDTSRYKRMAGYDSNGVYNPYDTIIGYPDDVRFLMASGPFLLPQDSVLRIVLGIVLGEYEPDSPPGETLFVINDRWAQWQYDMNWFLSVKESQPTNSGIPALRILPNPGNRIVRISFSMMESQCVALKLYDMLGRMVKVVFEGHKTKGDYELQTNLGKIPPGTYFLVLETPTSRSVAKLVIIR
ncbi:MAG: T9SS type A sorting domain-containing protein [candidate division WOR-3 bacterium]